MYYSRHTQRAQIHFPLVIMEQHALRVDCGVMATVIMCWWSRVRRRERERERERELVAHYTFLPPLSSPWILLLITHTHQPPPQEQEQPHPLRATATIIINVPPVIHISNTPSLKAEISAFKRTVTQAENLTTV